jgi:predicted acyl esterase
LKNIKDNNGKVGQYGTSYPGFYTAVGILAQHPALVASSPQRRFQISGMTIFFTTEDL